MNVNGDELMRLWPMLVRVVARRLPAGEWDTAEDIAAETVRRALTAPGELDAGRSDGLRRWLMVTAGRLVATWYRRRAVIRFEGLDTVDRTRGSIDAGTDEHISVIDLHAAIEQLKPRDRHTALDSLGTGHTLVATAIGAGMAESGAKHKAQRIRARLRPLLEVVP